MILSRTSKKQGKGGKGLFLLITTYYNKSSNYDLDKATLDALVSLVGFLTPGTGEGLPTEREVHGIASVCMST